MPHNTIRTARCAALVGPYLAGKTTLLESLLFAAGAISRKGSVRDGNSVGDSAPEAKARKMSTEVNAASFEYLGERWSILDCPGSVELACESQNALMAADLAVVVAEAAPDKAVLLAPLFKFLDDRRIPHILFINKIDTLGDQSVRAVVSAYQEVSTRKLVLRAVPMREQGVVTGLVDLVSERAWRFNPHKPSNPVSLPDALKTDESEARQALLESIADFDDALLEKLLEDMAPDADAVYDSLAQELANDQIVPVFFGSAENDNGVRRLLKALRHEGPEVAVTAARVDAPAQGAVAVQIVKTQIGSHAGKLSLARVWRGEVADGMILGGERVSGVFRLFGHEQTKIPTATAGDLVALGRLDKAATGDRLTDANGGKGNRLPGGLAGTPGSGLWAGAARRKPQRRRQAVLRHSETDGGGSFPGAGTGVGHRRIGAVGPGRHPSAHRHGPAARQIQRRGQGAGPANPLSGKHPQGNQPPRPL